MKNISINEILEAISNLNLIDLNKLIFEIEKKFNVTNEENIKEKTKFNIYLKKIGEKKINLIKIIKEITNLSLKESKELVEKENSLIKNDISKKECEEIEKKINSIGGLVEIK